MKFEVSSKCDLCFTSPKNLSTEENLIETTLPGDLPEAVNQCGLNFLHHNI